MNVELKEVEEWGEIRKNLNQEYLYDDKWENAINLFAKRLNRKYFNPINSIISKKVLKGEGFTIVTIQCALIEMFSAFRKGKIFNNERNSSSPTYEYRESQKMFTNLLRTSDIFKDNFWQLNEKGKPSIDKPFNAKDFYVNVRCALIHEARTKGNWYITATPLSKSVKTEKRFLVQNGKDVKIYRTILHHRLLKYFDEYKEELRSNDFESRDLRKFFARKLDHLFDFKPDAKFDWWSE